MAFKFGSRIKRYQRSLSGKALAKTRHEIAFLADVELDYSQS